MSRGKLEASFVKNEVDPLETNGHTYTPRSRVWGKREEPPGFTSLRPTGICRLTEDENYETFTYYFDHP